MATVSTLYLDGIREGRRLLNTWKAEGILTRNLLEVEITETIELCNRIAGCAYSEQSSDYFNGQIDFFRNQLKTMPGAAGDPDAPEEPKAPYPFCRHPEKCAGKGYCPEEFACND